MGRVRLGAMPEYLLCKADELPRDGEAREFPVAGRAVCVANADGQLSALDNVCIHRGGPLSQGLVEDGKIICPWHGWAFDLSTGCAAHNDAQKAKKFPLRVQGETVFITIE